MHGQAIFSPYVTIFFPYVTNFSPYVTKLILCILCHACAKNLEIPAKLVRLWDLGGVFPYLISS